jgi:mannose-6-phosphate isomerase
MKMQPVLVERPWGGHRLADLLGKAVAPGARIGESWELSDLPHSHTRVAEGPMVGQTLHEVLGQHGVAVLGREYMARGWDSHFGLLVKFIDATDRATLQVHAEGTASGGGAEGWVVVHADPGAWLVNGLKAGVTRDSLAAALKQGKVEDCLAIQAVKAGDFIWVPAGVVHAIGPGVVVAGVLQRPDATFSMYDWGHNGPDGKAHGLQVREGLEAIRYSGEGVPAGGRGKTADETGLVIDHLVDGPALSLSRITLDRRPWAADTRGTPAVLVVLVGTARLTTAEGVMDVRAGDTVLVPADAKEYALEQPARLTVLVAAPSGKAPQR